MPDLKVRKEPKPKRAGKRPKGVTVRTVRDADGGKQRILAVDTNSPTFSEDFLYVFTQNVRRARRANKALLGTPSGVKRQP